MVTSGQPSRSCSVDDITVAGMRITRFHSSSVFGSMPDGSGVEKMSLV